jgi:hypothetical protein
MRWLAELQSGNPRWLKSPDYSRKPHSPFGIKLDSEEIAVTVEAKVHERLQRKGHGLKSDAELGTGNTYQREWFMDIHPDEVWKTVVEEAIPFLK